MCPENHTLSKHGRSAQVRQLGSSLLADLSQQRFPLVFRTAYSASPKRPNYFPLPHAYHKGFGLAVKLLGHKPFCGLKITLYIELDCWPALMPLVKGKALLSFDLNCKRPLHEKSIIKFVAIGCCVEPKKWFRPLARRFLLRLLGAHKVGSELHFLDRVRNWILKIKIVDINAVKS